MKLPEKYINLDSKYHPFVRYLSVLPEQEFCSFLETIKNRKGVSREFHGYEIESNSIEFWDASNDDERTVEISYREFVGLIEPLSHLIIESYPDRAEQIESMMLEIAKE